MFWSLEKGEFSSSVPALKQSTRAFKAKFGYPDHVGMMTGKLASSISVIRRREGSARMVTVGIDRNIWTDRIGGFNNRTYGKVNVAKYAQKLQKGGKNQAPRPVISLAIGRFISDVFPALSQGLNAVIKEDIQKSLLTGSGISVSKGLSIMNSKISRFGL